MLSTSYMCFEISFQNTNESFIFNTTIESTNELARVLNVRKPLYFKAVKEYDKAKGRFKRCSKEWFLKVIDFNTELYELLK